MTTKTTMALAEFAGNGADSDLLREMIQYVAQRIRKLRTDECALWTASEGDWRERDQLGVLRLEPMILN